MKEHRRIDGRLFVFEGFERTKKDAQKDAKKWRKSGYLCRVIPTTKGVRRIEGERWALYRSKGRVRKRR